MNGVSHREKKKQYIRIGRYVRTYIERTARKIIALRTLNIVIIFVQATQQQQQQHSQIYVHSIAAAKNVLL